MGERRRRACVAAEFDAAGQRATGTIRNVSESGLFLGTASLPDVGDPVEISFRARGGESVCVSGLVWWTTRMDQETNFCRPPGFGMRLLEDDADLLDLVECA